MVAKSQACGKIELGVLEFKTCTVLIFFFKQETDELCTHVCRHHHHHHDSVRHYTAFQKDFFTILWPKLKVH